MSDVRSIVRALRAVYSSSEVSKWPTCLLCTETSALRNVDGRPSWVPVEGYRIEPEPGKYFKSQERGMRGYFEIVAECTHHGTLRQPDVQRARIHVPWWWGRAHEEAAIRELMFFGRDSQPEHGLVTRIH